MVRPVRTNWSTVDYNEGCAHLQQRTGIPVSTKWSTFADWGWPQASGVTICIFRKEYLFGCDALERTTQDWLFIWPWFYMWVWKFQPSFRREFSTHLA